MSEASNIPRLPLSFKPKTIKAFEKVNGPITDNLDISVDKLTKIIQAGNGNCPEETADDILATFLDGGGDVVEALVQIIEALQRGGFLPRDLAIAQLIRRQVRSQMMKLVGELEKDLDTLEATQESQTL